jgi:Na+-translocating ferredoxin:NAD+ oxidoreductase RnfD subunit
VNDISETLNYIREAGAIMREMNGVIKTQRETIVLQKTTITEQDKAIDNLVDAIKTHTGDTAKARAAEKAAAERPYTVGKTSNYGRSLWIGFREAILFAPTALVREFKLPLGALFGGIFLLIRAAVRWIIQRFGILILGVAGRLSPRKETT